MTNFLLKKDQVKAFVENLLSSKRAKFFLKRINNNLNKCQERIQNNNEYSMDWN